MKINILPLLSVSLLISACSSVVAMNNLTPEKLISACTNAARDLAHGVNAAVEGTTLNDHDQQLFENEVAPLILGHAKIARFTNKAHTLTQRAMNRKPSLVALIPGTITAATVFATVASRKRLPVAAVAAPLAGVASWIGCRELFMRKSQYAAYANPTTLLSRAFTWLYEKIAACRIAHKHVPQNVLNFASDITHSKSARTLGNVDLGKVPNATKSFVERLAKHQV